MPRLQGERALKGEHALKIITVLFVVIFLAAPPVRADGLAETIALAPPQYRQQLEKQLPLAGKNQAQLLAAIREAPPERREAMAVLLAYMPERDLTTLGKDYLLRNVEYACKAHDEMPWGKRIGAEMFHNYVLPYASVNERRDDWRKDFWQRFAGVVRACRTPTEAALLLNKEVYRQFNVKFHAPTYFSAEQSPYESAKTGFASCTGMSILLVSACRSVGIPARLTGSPYWTDKTENHSWVEIWDRQWQPIDAGEPGPFGETWVEWAAARIDPKSREHGIFAVSFMPAGTWFHFVWGPENHNIPADDVTLFYTARKRATFRVVDRPGGRPVPAKIAVRCGGRLVAEDTVKAPIAFFLAGGTTHDVELQPSGSGQVILRQVPLSNDNNDEEIELTCPKNP